MTESAAFDPNDEVMTGAAKPGPSDRYTLAPARSRTWKKRTYTPQKRTKTTYGKAKKAKRPVSTGKTYGRMHHKYRHHHRSYHGSNVVRPLKQPMNYFQAKLLTSWNATKPQFVMQDKYNCCIRWMQPKSTSGTDSPNFCCGFDSSPLWDEYKN